MRMTKKTIFVYIDNSESVVHSLLYTEVDSEEGCLKHSKKLCCIRGITVSLPVCISLMLINLLGSSNLTQHHNVAVCISAAAVSRDFMWKCNISLSFRITF